MHKNKLTIISYGSEPFTDRREAGWLLARELIKFRGKNAVVLGIPRGGVVIAAQIADNLDAELDIVFARKLGAPGNPELAVGAVGETGEIFLNKNLLRQWGGPVDIKSEKERQMASIRQRSWKFRQFRPKIPLFGRVVILTDDGIATGATVQAALWSVRQEGPEKIIVALPVGPPSSLRQLADDADEVICLRAPGDFQALSQFYAHFGQVDDDEVLEILKKSDGIRNHV